MPSPSIKLGVLIGSGVSLCSGAPSTEEITQLVRSGEDVHCYNEGEYFISRKAPARHLERACLDRILLLLDFLRQCSDDFFQEHDKQRAVKYEDLYYLVAQLDDAVTEYENPALSHLLKDVQKRFIEPSLPGGAPWQSDRLLSETRAYIKGILDSLLFPLQPRTGHLDSLVRAAKDSSVTRLDLFTLNHDLLIEHTLQREGIQYSEGFGPAQGEWRFWNHALLARGKRVRLYKLHGSVNWYALDFGLGTKTLFGICTRDDHDINHARGPFGRRVRLIGERPEMLVGTFNKMLGYTMGIYADLFCLFRNALRSLDRLLISGYSCGDKAINACISEWARASAGRRILIVAPDATGYGQTARGAIRRMLRDCAGQITLRDAKFADLSWQNIRDWATARDC